MTVSQKKDDKRHSSAAFAPGIRDAVDKLETGRPVSRETVEIVIHALDKIDLTHSHRQHVDGILAVLDEGNEAPVGDNVMADSLTRGLIAEAVRHVDLHDFPVWNEIEKKLTGAEFVAVEVDASTIDIDDHGAFFGRANLLLTRPFAGFNGEKVMASVAVPADVTGLVGNEPNHVDVSSFALRG